MTENLRMKTIRMRPEFLAELDREDPERGRTLQMHFTTDGTDVPMEELEAEARRLIRNRKEGKCKVMTSYPEEPRESRTVAELLAYNAGLTKKVRRGCPNKGRLCGCLGTCQDIIDVPISDPRVSISEER